MLTRSIARPAWIPGRRKASRLAIVTALCAAAAAAAGSAAVAAEAAISAGHGTAAVVVMERTRPVFGKMLVTTSGRALYVLPHGTCTGGCLTAWPRLVMPRGTTIPRGAPCLATAHFGTAGRLQVTYRKMRLYTFSGDTGRSVTGNKVDGFAVARVVRCAGPTPTPAPSPTSRPSPTPTGMW